MKAVLEKKKAKIYSYINSHGMLFVSMVKPVNTPTYQTLIISEQTVEMLMPVMDEDQLRTFYESEMKITKRMNLEDQKVRIQAELDSLCDEEP